MRIPQYLSHSGVGLWQINRQEFYRNYLCTTRTPRTPQANYMSIGAGFDAYAKSALHEALFGKGHDPQFEFTTIFESQVEPHNRDWALEHGKYVFDCYVLTGAYQELLDMLVKSLEPPQFEFTKHGLLGEVPVVGKPDCKFKHECGVNVVLDWKVHGYCSIHNPSPAKHYRLCRDAYLPPLKASKSHNTAHKGYLPYDHHGFEIHQGSLNEANMDYANQLSLYCWLLGTPVGDMETVCCIDEEIVCKYQGDGVKPILRVANHRARIATGYQEIVYQRYQDCWNAIKNGMIFDELSKAGNQQRCAELERKFAVLQSDGTAEGDFFLEAARVANHYQGQPMFEIRSQTAADVHHLLDIDLKCFDEPWPIPIWRRVGKDCLISVACWNHTPVGFVIFIRHFDGDIEVIKFAVKPTYRRMGISRQLMRVVNAHASEAESPVIRMAIPESRLTPGEPDELSSWATKLGFRAKGYLTPTLVNFVKCSSTSSTSACSLLDS